MRPAALWIMVAFAMHLSIVLTASLSCRHTEPPGVMSFDAPQLADVLLIAVAAWFLGLTYVFVGVRCLFSRARRELDEWSFAYASFGTLVAALTVALALVACVVEGTTPRAPAILILIAWVGGGVLLTLGARELRRRTALRPRPSR